MDETDDFDDAITPLVRSPDFRQTPRTAKPPQKRRSTSIFCFVTCLVVAVTAVTVILLVSFLTKPPAPAPVPTSGGAVASPDFSLDVLCNHRFVNGTCRSFFSYTASADVDAPLGVANAIVPSAHGQRTHFAAGRHFGAASFVWNCQSHPHATWSLVVDGRHVDVTVPRHEVACPSLSLAIAAVS